MLRQATSRADDRLAFDDVPPAGGADCHGPTVDPATCSVADLLASFGVNVDYAADQPADDADDFDPVGGRLDEAEMSFSDDDAEGTDQDWDWFADRQPRPSGGGRGAREGKPRAADDKRHFSADGVRYTVANDVPAGETDAEAAVRVSYALINGSTDPVIRFLGDVAAGVYVRFTRCAQHAWNAAERAADAGGHAKRLIVESEQMYRLLTQVVRSFWAMELGRARAPTKPVDPVPAAAWNAPPDVPNDRDLRDDYDPIRAGLLGDIEPGDFTIEGGLSRMSRAAYCIALAAFEQRPRPDVGKRRGRLRDHARVTTALGALARVSFGARAARREFLDLAARRPIRVTVTWTGATTETKSREPAPEMTLPVLPATGEKAIDDEEVFVA